MKILAGCLTLVVLTFLVAGCSGALENPTGPVAAPGNASQGLAKGPALHSAMGSGRVLEFWGMETKFMFTFNARELGGGEGAGEVSMLDHAGLKFHGKVFGLKVDGNLAKLNWTFTSGPWTGMYGTAIVEDNGEGSGCAADKISGVLWTDGSDIGSYTIPELIAMTPTQFITWAETYLFPVLMGLPPGMPFLIPCEGGNVQVR
jgi:hypothetical protein